jgi:hypothetical protein
VGYTAGTGSNGAAVGVFIPRNEASILFDVLGNALGFKGRAPNNALMINSGCIVLDGLNDYVEAPSGLELFNDSRNAWSIRVNYAPTSLSGVRRIVAQQGASAASFKGVSIYTNGTNLLCDIINSAGGRQLTAQLNGLTLVTGTVYQITASYSGNKLVSGVTWVVNGVSYTSSIVSNTLTVDDIASGTPLRIGSDTGLSLFGAGGVANVTIRDGSGTAQINYPCADNSSGFVFDASGFGRHGRLVNGVTRGTQNVFHNNIISGFSRCMQFDGIDDHVGIPGVTLPASPWRVDFSTIMNQGQAVSNGFFGQNAFTSGFFSNAGSSNFAIHDGTSSIAVLVSSYVFPVNQFTRLSCRRTASNFEVYDVTSGSDVLIASSAGLGGITSFIVTAFGTARSRLLLGTMFDVKINNTGNNTTWTHTWDGYGNTANDWLATLGGQNGTPSGSPLNVMVPAVNSTIDAIGAPTRNPAGAWHNGAGTQLDLTGGVASPAAVQGGWETAWAFNTARTNPRFKRTITLDGSDYRADRFLAYQSTLSGADLTKVQNFTATRAI